MRGQKLAIILLFCIVLVLSHSISVDAATYPSRIELEVSQTTIDFGEMVLLQGRLVDMGGRPIDGVEIIFLEDDEVLGRSVTDIDGIASFNLNPNVGRVSLTAEFKGTRNYSGARSTSHIIEVMDPSVSTPEFRLPEVTQISYSAFLIAGILTLGVVGTGILYLYSKTQSE